MTPFPTITVEQIDAALAAVGPHLSEDEQRLGIAVFRLLASGLPVAIDRAAAAANIAAGDAARIVDSWNAVFRDRDGRIVGFWGLALQAMAHTVNIGGVDLYAWCAWDPFLLALIIGDTGVTTHDPITGEAISYRLGPDVSIRDLSHPDSVLSFLRPDQPWGDNVMETFCHFVNQFSGPSSAQTWTTNHPGTFVISLEDAGELARRWVDRGFGSAVAAHGGNEPR